MHSLLADLKFNNREVLHIALQISLHIQPSSHQPSTTICSPLAQSMLTLQGFQIVCWQVIAEARNPDHHHTREQTEPIAALQAQPHALQNVQDIQSS